MRKCGEEAYDAGLFPPVFLEAIHSAALMLEHLGEHDAAQRILKALSEQSNALSTSSAAPLSTTAVGDAIAERL